MVASLKYTSRFGEKTVSPCKRGRHKSGPIRRCDVTATGGVWKRRRCRTVSRGTSLPMGERLFLLGLIISFWLVASDRNVDRYVLSCEGAKGMANSPPPLSPTHSHSLTHYYRTIHTCMSILNFCL